MVEWLRFTTYDLCEKCMYGNTEVGIGMVELAEIRFDININAKLFSKLSP
jgi:hypothetical protein